MMHKGVRYSILIVMILLASCSKDYQCVCTVQDSPTSASAANTNTANLAGYSKDGALDACESRERFSVDSVKINCQLQ
ncbi:MAG: hypothetical protein H6551_13550 [Chitinophagales bacterium]|nr:hypothetical protein [Chitinophagaceae bacterium]MCB9066159.1 hypothetical protein [Chitinophagales bacterium]